MELRGTDSAVPGADSEDVSVAAEHHQHHKDTIPQEVLQPEENANNSRNSPCLLEIVVKSPSIMPPRDEMKEKQVSLPALC